MKKATLNSVIPVLLSALVVALFGAGIISSSYATADTEIEASFVFYAISDTECEVGCTNRKDATFAVIPSTAVIDGITYTVTQVKAVAFSHAENLKSIILPSTVEIIGELAFSTCAALVNAYLPNVETVCTGAFLNCRSLKSVYLPQIKEIRQLAFYHCASMTEIYLSPDIEKVGPYAFLNGADAEEIIMSDMTSALNDGTDSVFFESVSQKSFDIPLLSSNLHTEFSSVKVYDFILEDVNPKLKINFDADRIAVHVPTNSGYISMKLSLS